MREITASEASRNFSALLDAIEAGETVAVTRGGRRVASFSPAPPSSGDAFAEVLRRRRAARPASDDALGRAVDDGLSILTDEMGIDRWTD
jgi:antitoxin (DNA-binding transcriptional repressor) of toxin-antitoxin stability system